MTTTLTPAEQAAAFAAAVGRAGIRADFGELNEAMQSEYWAAQARACMGPDWDGQNADVAAFAAAIGLAPGRTVTRTVHFGEQTDAFFYSGALQSAAWPPATERHTRYDIQDPDQFVPYSLALTRVPTVPEALNFADRAWSGESRVFSVCGGSVQIHVDMGAQERPELMDLMEFLVTARIWYPDGEYEECESYWMYVSYSGYDQTSMDIRSPHYPACSEEYPSLFEFAFDTERRSILVRMQALTPCYREGDTHVIAFPYQPGPERFIEMMPYLSFFPNTVEDKPVRFTMASGGGGGGSTTRTLHFKARAGASGTHGDPYTGEFAIPAPRTEVPAYGTGGYGGHGGGGGAGGATTIIRRFTTTKADALTQTAQTSPHGYGSPGGQASQGGDGCILIFW